MDVFSSHYRLYIDYRGLNAITIKNRYPLPLINESLARLSGAVIYTKLDLRDTYYRIRIKEGDKQKTAFRTRYSYFEYTIIPFGLTNAPTTFQAYVNRVLIDLINTQLVVYLNNILIFSRDLKSYIQVVRTILIYLIDQKLFIKLSKYAFYIDQIEFLGFIISYKGVAIDPIQIETIRQQPALTYIFDI